MGSLTKEEIVQEIRKGSEIGKQIFEIELDYYKSLVKDKTPTAKVYKV